MTFRSAIWNATPCLLPIGTPNAVALVGVRHRLLEHRLDAPDGQGSDRDPPVVERGQELGETPASLAKQVVGGDAAAGERQWPCVSEACQPSLS